MNSKPKNSLEYSKPQLEEKISDNTILEVMPQKTDEDVNTRYVVIKHDYYSSDSDHGRGLLVDFISSICESSYNTVIVYLIDKGVRLLDENNPLYDDMVRLIEKSEFISVSKESLIFYDVAEPSDHKIVIQSSKSIAEDIIYLNNPLILE